MSEDTQALDDVDLLNDTDANDGSVATASESDDDAGGEDSFEKLLMLPFTEARARALADFDKKFLSAALARHNGNIARTARSLGLHRQSLQKLMARRGIKSVRLPT